MPPEPRLARLGIRLRRIVTTTSIQDSCDTVLSVRRAQERTGMRLLCAALVLTIGVAAATDGARNAEIAAAIKTRIDAKKGGGLVVATIEPADA